MIEVEVHQQLRAFLREQGEPFWPHHLTMARLVARALRLGRSALLQAEPPSGGYGRYRLSYLMPVLCWPESVVIVAPEGVQQRLLMVEIPRLQQWISSPKTIRRGDRWPGADFQGLLLMSPEAWLSDRLAAQPSIPDGIPTILDGADDLESWAHNHLTAQVQPLAWNDLMLACPEQAELIRDTRVFLTRSLFQHPSNPYGCHLVEAPERSALEYLRTGLPVVPGGLPEVWQRFWQEFTAAASLLWATVDRRAGQFTLQASPVELAPTLRGVWERQPVVVIGGALDLEAEAPIYRQRLGLGELTCIKFAPDRQTELIQLYLPEFVPMPNTPEYQGAVVRELRSLLSASAAAPGPAVVLVGDVPLKAQLGSLLAAEFGSRVQVERTCLDEKGILVTGWEFWRQHQSVLPAPSLLAIATLPLPSLEHPLVAGRVAYYKQQRQDWFRLYLLPEALAALQRAIAPVRERQGVVALLDSRVVHRTYGQQVMTALSPLARINYLDPTLFTQPDR